MKLTIKHYFDFGEKNTPIGPKLDDPLGWDILLAEGRDDPAFFIPSDRSAWEQKCLRNQAIEFHAQDIARIIQSHGFKRANSFGVGAGFLEYWIKKKVPSIFLQCSDYTSKGIDRLRQVFPEADEIIYFDMLKNAWSNGGSNCLYLFYRIDTAFDDQQWREIFFRLRAAGIEYILFIPSEFLTLKRFFKQKLKCWLYRCLGKKLTWAGYLRTKGRLEDLFASSYKIKSFERIGDLNGYLLNIKERYG